MDVEISRVQKTLNSSYKPDPEILNLPTLSRTRQQNDGTKLSKIRNRMKIEQSCTKLSRA